MPIISIPQYLQSPVSGIFARFISWRWERCNNEIIGNVEITNRLPRSFSMSNPSFLNPVHILWKFVRGKVWNHLSLLGCQPPSSSSPLIVFFTDLDRLSTTSAMSESSASHRLTLAFSQDEQLSDFGNCRHFLFFNHKKTMWRRNIWYIKFN